MVTGADAAARYLGFFEVVKRLHVQAFGRDLELYKPTEPECLVAVFDHLFQAEHTGEAFVTELIHRLV